MSAAGRVTEILSIFSICAQEPAKGAVEQHAFVNEPENIDDSVSSDAEQEIVPGLSHLAGRIGNMFPAVANVIDSHHPR